MSSINQNQPEHNHENLHQQQAVEKIKEIVKDVENCFFCTAVGKGPSGGVRPMNVRQIDDQGNLWFLSPNDSSQNEELEIAPTVKLYFQSSKHAGFLFLNGLAVISTDRAKIQELWQPMIRTWFTEGVDDPRITVIKVIPTDGYYWDNKHGNAVAGIKMMIGAALGTTLDDSIEGKIEPMK